MTTASRAVHRRLLTGALALTLSTAALVPASAAPAPSSSPSAQEAVSDWNATAYRGHVDVVRDGSDADAETLDGTVFVDRNRNSVQDRGEPGRVNVRVSNGLDVVRTDARGRYELPVRDNMTVTVTQPAGYIVPVDQHNVAQFSYTHLPEGSPANMERGLEPTGALPDAVNFPIAHDPAATGTRTQDCVMAGDTQVETEAQVEYARSGAFTDLSQRDDYSGCGVLFVGDVVEEGATDLLDDMHGLMGMLNGPVRALPGNNDIDVDDTTGEHEFDSFRQEFGPTYYSYDVGQLHVIALESIQYPVDGDYNSEISDVQMQWLANDLAQTPKNRLIVLATHAPLVDFGDQTSRKHQVDQATEIYDLLDGRQAVNVAGHKHSLENQRAGDSTAGWSSLFGIDQLPFDHLVVGAISGEKWTGRMLEGGYPTGLQRDGVPGGVYSMHFSGTRYTDSFTATGADAERQMSLSLNTPDYRDWYRTYADAPGEAPALASAGTVGSSELAESWLVTNLWTGSTDSTVTVSIDGGTPTAAQHTQPLEGEGVRKGAEWSDPAAALEQLVHGGRLSESSMHQWHLPLPAELTPGEHTATVTATDHHGRVFTDELSFTVTD